MIKASKRVKSYRNVKLVQRDEEVKKVSNQAMVQAIDAAHKKRCECHAKKSARIKIIFGRKECQQNQKSNTV
jgi:hypothetical protein